MNVGEKAAGLIRLVDNIESHGGDTSTTARIAVLNVVVGKINESIARLKVLDDEDMSALIAAATGESEHPPIGATVDAKIAAL